MRVPHEPRRAALKLPWRFRAAKGGALCHLVDRENTLLGSVWCDYRATWRWEAALPIPEARGAEVTRRSAKAALRRWLLANIQVDPAGFDAYWVGLRGRPPLPDEATEFALLRRQWLGEAPA